MFDDVFSFNNWILYLDKFYFNDVNEVFELIGEILLSGCTPRC